MLISGRVRHCFLILVGGKSETSLLLHWLIYLMNSAQSVGQANVRFHPQFPT